MENSIAWVSYMHEIHIFFASNSKFGISVNKMFIWKYFLVIFVLLFIDSFQIVSDFLVNLTNLHTDFQIG